MPLSLVFITTYRKPVLRGDVATEVRDMLSVPPHLAPSRVMQAMKGKTSRHLLMDRRQVRETFWDRHLSVRGYFVATSSNVTDDVVAEYVRLQGVEPQSNSLFATTKPMTMVNVCYTNA